MSQDLITIHGEEQSKVDETLADGGLPLLPGVESYCVFRASRDAQDLSDGRGWTYHHHVDMAIWRGRLYVGWNSCERDEDIWPARELFSTSTNGRDWSPPAEMFPQGLSTCLRVYFFRAPNDRMLVIAGLRGGTDKVNEDTKGALLVREIRADHSWGEVYLLQGAVSSTSESPFGAALNVDDFSAAPKVPFVSPLTGARIEIFETSNDPGFIEACRALLADTVFLEQQDRGRLLGPRRMKWHDPANWPGGKVPGDNEKWVAGKAYTFFTRPDGAIIGLSKMGWVTISLDNGKTWQQPAVPSSFVTGKAKVFSHRLSDGTYALVYNPSRRNRFPLAIVTGSDGVNFANMRLIQGELPIQRYAGADRSIGPQYTRGVSKWADDGSRDDGALWLVYSMSKEDIWVSRVPVPVAPDETRESGGGFTGWNLYQPKWSRAEVHRDSLLLENRDPFDYAAATRVLPTASHIQISFSLHPHQIGGVLMIDLMSMFGAKRPIQIALRNGQMSARDGQSDIALGAVEPNERIQFQLNVDAAAGNCAVEVRSGGIIQRKTLAFAEPADSIHRITFRTDEFRGIGGKKPVAEGTDKPTDVRAFEVRDFKWTSAQ